LTALGSCAAAPDEEYRPRLHYIGSSTIANFLRDAEEPYGRVQFQLDTEPESVGGENAVLEGRGDLAGVAGRPRAETLEQGVRALEIARDTIAVIVHPSNPVRGLTRQELCAVYSGRVENWKELGGDDRPVRALIVGPDSATRNVFRACVLREIDYAGCAVVRPDADMLTRVAGDPGAIGQLSRSFLIGTVDVKVLAVDGMLPGEASAYPIARPLFLLWWPGRRRVAEFAEWCLSPAGRAVLMKRFSLPGADGAR